VPVAPLQAGVQEGQLGVVHPAVEGRHLAVEGRHPAVEGVHPEVEGVHPVHHLAVEAPLERRYHQAPAQRRERLVLGLSLKWEPSVQEA